MKKWLVVYVNKSDFSATEIIHAKTKQRAREKMQEKGYCYRVVDVIEL